MRTEKYLDSATLAHATPRSDNLEGNEDIHKIAPPNRARMNLHSRPAHLVDPCGDQMVDYP